MYFFFHYKTFSSCELQISKIFPPKKKLNTLTFGWANPKSDLPPKHEPDITFGCAVPPRQIPRIPFYFHRFQSCTYFGSKHRSIT